MLAPSLRQFISLEKEVTLRNSAYFILGWLAKNTLDLESKQFLVDALGGETETGIILTILMIMIREGYSSEAIQQKVGQSADWVTHHQGRLSLLTHPDRTV